MKPLIPSRNEPHKPVSASEQLFNFAASSKTFTTFQARRKRIGFYQPTFAPRRKGQNNNTEEPPVILLPSSLKIHTIDRSSEGLKNQLALKNQSAFTHLRKEEQSVSPSRIGYMPTFTHRTRTKDPIDECLSDPHQNACIEIKDNISSFNCHQSRH